MRQSTKGKGLDGTYSQNRGQRYRENKKNRGDKIAIGTIHRYATLMEMGGSENFC